MRILAEDCLLLSPFTLKQFLLGFSVNSGLFDGMRMVTQLAQLHLQRAVKVNCVLKEENLESFSAVPWARLSLR